MRFTRFFIEVERADKGVGLCCLSLFFGYTFRVERHEFGDARDRVTWCYHLVDFVAMGFVDTNSLSGLIAEVGFPL